VTQEEELLCARPTGTEISIFTRTTRVTLRGVSIMRDTWTRDTWTRDTWT
jgi:hypothetical protein